jgi:hypothetical protein
VLSGSEAEEEGYNINSTVVYINAGSNRATECDLISINE